MGAVRPLLAPSWLMALPRTTREHLVPVPARLGEALEHHQADTLGEAGAVGLRGERLAAPVGGQAALAGELDEHHGARHHGHTARQRQRASP